MKTNKSVKFTEKTHEGAPAARINAKQQLRRSIMACLLWEKGFYESGEDIASRITSLVPQVDPEDVAAMAVEARGPMKLRHVPLLIVREMARTKTHKHLVARVLVQVIQRADELAEFVKLYWLDGRVPLSAQVKKGLAKVFPKFNAYQLAKYNRDGEVKLRDVLFLCHAKPKDSAQAETWKQLVDGALPIPNTWENRLSAGEDKKLVWESMIQEDELGALAFLKNLRNMKEAGVKEELVFAGLEKMKTDRVLPFRFIAAARYAPQWESKIEETMLRCVRNMPKLPGKTVLLIDVSGSMTWELSDKSDLTRMDAANGLAILARELCERVAIFSFSDRLVQIPDRHGFALRDAIFSSQAHSGTWLGRAVQEANKAMIESYDRLIVITDEQSHDVVPDPLGKGYMINVATYRNGVGYGKWTHIDGFSEAVFDYITVSEGNND